MKIKQYQIIMFLLHKNSVDKLTNHSNAQILSQRNSYLCHSNMFGLCSVMEIERNPVLACTPVE